MDRATRAAGSAAAPHFSPASPSACSTNALNWLIGLPGRRLFRGGEFLQPGEEAADHAVFAGKVPLSQGGQLLGRLNLRYFIYKRPSGSFNLFFEFIDHATDLAFSTMARNVSGSLAARLASVLRLSRILAFFRLCMNTE